ncbi:phage tail protein [Algoriphagus vanfongensis]|uniref:phage tail protein n=1 Tax=Algoriphagus vanfongensis TaxID=426371 RepID=UPI000414C51B|nr:tail fiber protein [Algoriphagus vanfongensis]
MDTPFIGQIELFGCNFAPRGWAMCQGQLLPISQNTALFSLLGTVYGGDGRTTFGLPDLRSRVVVGMGNGPGLSNYTLGQKLGVENVTLTQAELPNHTHGLSGVNGNGTSNIPTQNVLAVNNATIERGAGPVEGNSFANSSANVSMNQFSIGQAGGSLPHNNMQPSLSLNYCIALVGIFPSRN